ncbi:MAG TPA: tetratricopeptide repeat protein, partial [Actinomycetota bacterium]
MEGLLLKLGPRQLLSRLVASPAETVPWHYGMARSLERLGKKEEALSHARAAVELDPTSARCLGLRAWLELMTGPPDAATEDVLRRSAEMSPAGGLPRRLLAIWLDSRERTAE